MDGRARWAASGRMGGLAARCWQGEMVRLGGDAKWGGEPTRSLALAKQPPVTKPIPAGPCGNRHALPNAAMVRVQPCAAPTTTLN